ncbi:MAG: alpha/beta hydrolase [Rhizobiaceae bacterium]|nr:alpha/beta hydrolase [Rhizobiaceae bacterium]
MGFDRPQTLQSPTGALLSYFCQPAEGRVRGVVQILHGLAEHSGRYDRFAHFLAGRGFHVYAHDHRGHGHTRAPDAPFTVFAAKGGADRVLADVAAIRNVIVHERPNLPVILFGHSLGGLIALNCLQAFPKHVDAAAVWNAPIPSPSAARLAGLALAWETFRHGSDVPSRLMRRATFGAWSRAIPDARTPFDWLSRDPHEVDDYIADPLCGWDPSVSMWRDVFELGRRAREAARYAPVRKGTAIHLAGGGADPVTRNGKDVENLAAMLRRFEFNDVTVAIDPQARHETLNDTDRDRMMREFAEWADRHIRAAT